MTDGKRISSFELEVTYDKPRENPVELTQQNPLLMYLDNSPIEMSYDDLVKRVSGN